MPRLFKYIAYLTLFAVLYAIFLYWVFPYDALKDRILGEIERQVGGGVQVSAAKLEPYWFSGVDVEDLKIEGPSKSGLTTLLNVGRVRARAALIPLIFGSKRISFDLEIGKSGISGYARLSEDTLLLELGVDDLNLAELPLIRERTGLSIPSRIDGEARLEINIQRPVRSTGEITLELNDIAIAGSSIKLGDMEMELPDLTLAKGKESRIKLSVGRGTATFEELKLVGGDLGLDLKGKVFLSSKFENYRLNLRGSFTASEKLGEALPFLFIVDSQKQEDGSYPLNITGRITRPSIKIGTFKVPM